MKSLSPLVIRPGCAFSSPGDCKKLWAAHEAAPPPTMAVRCALVKGATLVDGATIESVSSVASSSTRSRGTLRGKLWSSGGADGLKRPGNSMDTAGSRGPAEAVARLTPSIVALRSRTGGAGACAACTAQNICCSNSSNDITPRRGLRFSRSRGGEGSHGKPPKDSKGEVPSSRCSALGTGRPGAGHCGPCDADGT